MSVINSSLFLTMFKHYLISYDLVNNHNSDPIMEAAEAMPHAVQLQNRVWYVSTKESLDTLWNRLRVNLGERDRLIVTPINKRRFFMHHPLFNRGAQLST